MLKLSLKNYMGLLLSGLTFVLPCFTIESLAAGTMRRMPIQQSRPVSRPTVSRPVSRPIVSRPVNKPTISSQQGRPISKPVVSTPQGRPVSKPTVSHPVNQHAHKPNPSQMGRPVNPNIMKGQPVSQGIKHPGPKHPMQNHEIIKSKPPVQYSKEKILKQPTPDFSRHKKNSHIGPKHESNKFKNKEIGGAHIHGKHFPPREIIRHDFKHKHALFKHKYHKLGFKPYAVLVENNYYTNDVNYIESLQENGTELSDEHFFGSILLDAIVETVSHNK